MYKTIYLYVITIVLGASIAYSFDACKALFPLPDFSKTDMYIKDIQKDGPEDHGVRMGKSWVHLHINSYEKESNVIFGFPAHNSGEGIWVRSDEKVKLESISSAKPVVSGQFHGAEIDVRSRVKNLEIVDQVLSSMRVVRDREVGADVASEVHNQKVSLVGNRLIYLRDDLSELFGYVLEIESIGDTRIVAKGNTYELQSPTEVKFKVRGLTNGKSPTPLALIEVFRGDFIRRADPKMLEELSFLFSKEKVMAGSPRYLSRFFRDLAITAEALMEHMQPRAIEFILSSMMSGMHPEKGLLSHEQSEGEFVSLELMKSGKPYKGVLATTEDYKMVDGEPLFAVLFAKYAKLYPDWVRDFMAEKDSRGIPHATHLKHLFKYLDRNTKAFADNPVYKNLMRFRKGEKVGEWRDSEDGPGGGVYSFNVNAALFPSALKAMSELAIFTEREKREYARRYEVWNTKVIPLFEVRAGNTKFPGISLDEKGIPVPVMHSDDSFILAYGLPTSDYIQEAVSRFTTPYAQGGLWTEAGISVVNSMYAPDSVKKLFGKKKYHSDLTSWKQQEAMIKIGVKRQLERTDLSQLARVALINLSGSINSILAGKADMAGTEVFTLEEVDGKFVAKPFHGDARTNRWQLWSYLPLALE
jgi:hypothetical protein